MPGRPNRRHSTRRQETDGTALGSGGADAVALIRQLIEQLDDLDAPISRRQLTDGLIEVEHAIHNSTQRQSLEPQPVLLVDESRYVTQRSARRKNKIIRTPATVSLPEVDTTAQPVHRGRESTGLYLTVYPQVGRATVSKPRVRYFEPVGPLSLEDQQERTRRSHEANARKAARKAADHAIAADCGIWATFTFAEAISAEGALEVSGGFLSDFARRQRSMSGDPCHYVAIVDISQGRPHIHALISRSVDPEQLKDAWEHGHIQSVELIPRNKIEEKVGYMAKRVRANRVTHARFLRSRRLKIDQHSTPVKDFRHARDTLADQIAPQVPRINSALPVGGHPRITFRFAPLDQET